MEKKILITVSIITIVVLIVWFVISRTSSSSLTPSVSISPTPVIQIKEGEHVDPLGPPDVRTDRLPDGSTIEYGTLGGPLSPRQEEELKKIIEQKKKGQIKKQSNQTSSEDVADSSILEQQPFFSFFFHTFPRIEAQAAGPIDNLQIDLGGSDPKIETTIRTLLKNDVLYWSPTDLQKLTKIVIVPDTKDISGAYGQWTFVKQYNPDASFASIEGVMWIAATAPIETTFIHEYGHHFTNYWAAMRTNGAWDETHIWPQDSAGDYYQLRPMKSGCSCASFDDTLCPYTNRIWEIIAEDYRTTAAVYNAGHIFANTSCVSGGGKVGLPDVNSIASYIAALPLTGSLTHIIITPGGPTPTSAPALCLGVQHCTSPFSTTQEYCGDCTGANCVPGNQCKDGTSQCLTYRDKVFATDQFYSLPCDKLPKLTAKSNAGGPLPSYFPRQPFSSCYTKGGVCTHEQTCSKFSGTTFEKDPTVCPSAEGCCVFPNPKPIAPTLTPCENEGGICTPYAATCTSQGGTLNTSKGCTSATQCCMFSALGKTYSNKDFQSIERQMQNGTVGSLAVSAWIENACRTPGLQAVGCDPNIEGDCEKLACISQ